MFKPVTNATNPLTTGVGQDLTGLSAETRLFSILRSLRLVISLLRPPTGQGAVSASSEIDVNVIQIADDILVGAERWHDAGVAGTGNLTALDNYFRELLIGHVL
jgi:hypothetical protein